MQKIILKMHLRTTSLFVQLTVPALLLVTELPAAWNAPSETNFITSLKRVCPKAESILNSYSSFDVAEQLTCENSSKNEMCQMLELSTQVLCAAPTLLSKAPYNLEKYTGEPICHQIQSLLEYNNILSKHPDLGESFMISPENLVTSCEKQCNFMRTICSLIIVINREAMNLSNIPDIAYRSTSEALNPQTEKGSQQNEKRGESPAKMANEANPEYLYHKQELESQKQVLTSDRNNKSNLKLNTTKHEDNTQSGRQNNPTDEAVIAKQDQKAEQKIEISPGANSSISNEQTAALKPEDPEKSKPESAGGSASHNQQISVKPNAEATEINPIQVEAEKYSSSTKSVAQVSGVAGVVEKVHGAEEGIPDDNGTGDIPIDTNDMQNQDSMEEPNSKVGQVEKTEKLESEDNNFGKSLLGYSSGRANEKPIMIRPNVETDSGYFSYFILFLAVCAILFILVQNKKRIIAMVIEGRKPRHARRRSSSGSYRKLENNFD